MPQTNHANQVPQPGERVDLAPFAWLRWWTGTEKQDLHVHPIFPAADGTLAPARDPETGEWHLGLEWENERDVCQVSVQYAGAVPPDFKVQYWRKNWPTPAPERLPGARRGWIARDDPFHGQWVTVRGELTVEGSTATLTFDPIDVLELGGRDAIATLESAKDFLARFRHTLKLRLVSGGEQQPVISAVHVYSASRWQEGKVDVHFGPEGDWSGQAEPWNGHLLGVEAFNAQDTVDSSSAWHCAAAGGNCGVRLHLLYTDAGPASDDRTVVTLWTAARSFSFQLADLKDGPIYIPDYGVFVHWAGNAG